MTFHSGCILGVPCAFTVTKVDVFQRRESPASAPIGARGSFGRAENEK